jgi:hypothetical protein
VNTAVCSGVFTQVDVLGAANTTLYRIKNNGSVAGYLGDSRGESHGIIWPLERVIEPHTRPSVGHALSCSMSGTRRVGECGSFKTGLKARTATVIGWNSAPAAVLSP